VHVRKFPRDKWRMIYSSHDGAQAAVQITHRVQKTFAVRDSNSYICINVVHRRAALTFLRLFPATVLRTEI